MKINNSDKRDLIINKATELFAKKGFDSVKISDITNSISIGKGTFYLYFQNKQDLLYECFRSFSKLPTPIEQEMDLAGEKDLYIRMTKRLEHLMKNFSQSRGILNLIWNSIASEDKEASKVAMEAYGSILCPVKRDIEHAIASGIFPETDAELMSYFLVGGGEHLAFRFTLDNKYTPQQILDFIRSALFLLATERTTLHGEAPQARFARITDSSGIETKVEDVLFGGNHYLAGKMGEAEIQMDLDKVSFLAANEVNQRLTFDYVLDSGNKGTISVDENILVSGKIEFGDFKILLKNIHKITFTNKADSTR